MAKTDPFVAMTECHFMNEQSMAEMSYYPQFQRWAIDIIGFSKDYPRGMAASKAVREYLMPVIADRRARPAGDVISKLVTGTVDGQGLSDEEVVSFLRLLLPASGSSSASGPAALHWSVPCLDLILP